MRRLLRWPSALAAPFRMLGAISDERNARRLAKHLHCSLPEARMLYRHARREGYGAAHDAMFPGQGRVQTSGGGEPDGRAEPVDRQAVQGEVSQVPPA